MTGRTKSKAFGCGAALLLVASSAGADSMASGDPQQQFTVKDFATQLGPVTDFRFLPDGRMVIASLDGTVYLRKQDGTVVTAGKVPVTTSDLTGTQGLLGVEIDPAFATNQRLIFYYSAGTSSLPQGTDFDRNRVSFFTLNGDSLNQFSEQVLVHGIMGPGIHNGGGLAIGPDQTTLFIGAGDTGCESGLPPDAGLPPSNFFPTCLSNPNGKILRVTLDGGIPSDNPLASNVPVASCGAACGSSVAGAVPPQTNIWAWGFRNPFRLSVDPVTGNLWVGDVGDVTYEEINRVQSGHHYGAPWREGSSGWDAAVCDTSIPGSGPCVDPVYSCRHDDGGIPSVDGNCGSVTGGLFVDSCTWPAAYQGRYFFGDAITRKVFMLQMDGTRTVTQVPNDGGSPRSLFATIADGGPVSFQVGPDKNLYVAVYPDSTAQGRVVVISPVTVMSCDGGGGSPDGGPPDGGGGPRPPRGPGVSGDVTPSRCGCGASDGATVVVTGLMVALLMARRRRRRA